VILTVIELGSTFSEGIRNMVGEIGEDWSQSWREEEILRWALLSAIKHLVTEPSQYSEYKIMLIQNSLIQNSKFNFSASQTFFNFVVLHVSHSRYIHGSVLVISISSALSLKTCL